MDVSAKKVNKYSELYKPFFQILGLGIRLM